MQFNKSKVKWVWKKNIYIYFNSSILIILDISHPPIQPPTSPINLMFRRIHPILSKQSNALQTLKSGIIFRPLSFITKPTTPTTLRTTPKIISHTLIQSRTLMSTKTTNLGPFKFTLQILTGVYCGLLIVSFGLCYLLYSDANQRQNIPFELSLDDHINAVMAINKDDVCESPRHATKHYRRLLIDLAKQELGDTTTIDESKFDNRYDVPILSTDFLIHNKSIKFINFYIDMILRYSKCLLSKGELDIAIKMLTRIVVDDDFIFFKLGDAEKLSSSSRVLAKITPDITKKISILQRSIDMLIETNKSMQIDNDYILLENSKISDELINCLNDLASNLAKLSQSQSQGQQELLNQSLQIYLSELRSLQTIRLKIESNQANQATYPLFNVDRANLIGMINTIKAHISEIMWVKGHKDKAINFLEQILQELYYDRYSDPKFGPILLNVLNNLEIMYHNLHKPEDVKRCQNLKHDISIYEIRNRFDIPWYDRVMKRISKTIYLRTPIGLVEKGLRDRFEPRARVKELDEFEDEDDENRSQWLYPLAK